MTAVSALERALGDNARPATEVAAELAAAGYSDRQIRRARQQLGVVSIRVGAPGDPDAHHRWIPKTVAMWEVLGVPEWADDAAVRAAYRRMMRDNHPDAGGAADAARLLGQAKQVLSDARVRGSWSADVGRVRAARDDRWDAEDRGDVPPPGADDEPERERDEGAGGWSGWSWRSPDDVHVDDESGPGAGEAASAAGAALWGWVQGRAPSWRATVGVVVVAVWLWLATSGPVLFRSEPVRVSRPDGVPRSVVLPSVSALPEPAAPPVECWDASDTMRAPCPQEGE